MAEPTFEEKLAQLEGIVNQLEHYLGLEDFSLNQVLEARIME